MTDQLIRLWQLAFGDEEGFIRLFFDTAYDPARCLYLTENSEITAALYWLDCEYRGQKQAYLYAVATHPRHRGKGLCRRLMDKAHAILREQGYSAALLRPADEGLRQMYRKMGYADCSTVSEFSCRAAAPIPIRKITPQEFRDLRRQYLPASGVIQEGVSLDYLASYASFYTGEDFLLAGSIADGRFIGAELLGNPNAASGILGALGCQSGSFRCPGKDIPFGMFLSLKEQASPPEYLGLVFD